MHYPVSSCLALYTFPYNLVSKQLLRGPIICNHIKIKVTWNGDPTKHFLVCKLLKSMKRQINWPNVMGTLFGNYSGFPLILYQLSLILTNICKFWESIVSITNLICSG